MGLTVTAEVNRITPRKRRSDKLSGDPLHFLQCVGTTQLSVYCFVIERRATHGADKERKALIPCRNQLTGRIGALFPKALVCQARVPIGYVVYRS